MHKLNLITALLAGICLATGGYGVLPATAQDTETADQADVPADRIAINWWFGLPGQLGETTMEMVDNFNNSQDQYFVVASYRGDYAETMNATVAAFRAGRHPEIVQIYEVGTLTMMRSGVVYPVHELMADMGYDVDWDAFVQPVLSYYVTPEGELLSMPFNSSTPIFYGNLDLMAEAGLEELPQTWDEVGDAAAALRDAGVACPFTTGWQSWVQLENYSAWHDIPFATQANGYGGLDSEVVFHTTQAADHIARLAEWSQDGRFVYQGRGGDAHGAFMAGDCALYTNSSAYFGSINRDAEFEWTAAELPHEAGQEPQNTIIGGATLWVLQGHDEEKYQAVAAFLDFVASPDNQSWWHKTTGYVPITVPAYEQTKEEGYYEEHPAQEIALTQLTRNEPTENSRGIRLGNFVQIREVINEELENIWAGNKTAEEGLNDAAERANAELRRYEAQQE